MRPSPSSMSAIIAALSVVDIGNHCSHLRVDWLLPVPPSLLLLPVSSLPPQRRAVAAWQWQRLPWPCLLPLRCWRAAHCRHCCCAAGKLPLLLPPPRFLPRCCRQWCHAATKLPISVTAIAVANVDAAPAITLLLSMVMHIIVKLIVIRIVFNSFNGIDPLRSLLADCCMPRCRGWGTMAAVGQWQLTWSAGACILLSFS